MAGAGETKAGTPTAAGAWRERPQLYGWSRMGQVTLLMGDKEVCLPGIALAWLGAGTVSKRTTQRQTLDPKSCSPLAKLLWCPLRKQAHGDGEEGAGRLPSAQE